MYTWQVSKTKGKLHEYQEELERQHREEEDRLMAQFHQERLVEAENMQKEFDTEWEKQLKALTDQNKKVRLLYGYAMVVHGRPTTPKNTSFLGVTQPPGVIQPLYSSGHN